MSRPSVNAVLFFKNDEIPFDSSIENSFEIFENVLKFYSCMLRNSIENSNLTKSEQPLFYNYLIFNGCNLKKILDHYDSLCLTKMSPTTEHFNGFKSECFYAGKGIDYRVNSHLINSKKIKMKKLKPKKVCAKFSKICRIWDNGGGVFVVKLFGECSSFEALSKEYAIIKAIGLNRLTNVINGTCYGDMKACWNETEVVNYGNMLLMNVFNMCIQETPVLVMENDVFITEKDSTETRRCKWEVEGMLECFLEM